MTDLRTAAWQALEAWDQPHGINYVDFRPYMEALRAALAEPVQEPVAQFHVEHRTNACSDICDVKGKVFATCSWSLDARQRAELICRLLNTAPTSHPEQKPVAWMDIDEHGQRHGLRYYSDGNREEVPLYAAPPQRKPLTEEEIFMIENSVPDEVVSDRKWTVWFARAIEKAHGIGVE